MCSLMKKGIGPGEKKKEGFRSKTELRKSTNAKKRVISPGERVCRGSEWVWEGRRLLEWHRGLES